MIQNVAIRWDRAIWNKSAFDNGEGPPQSTSFFMMVHLFPQNSRYLPPSCNVLFIYSWD